MFDPTAYENMKVVIQGYIYDKDLEGELDIIDRNDVVNLAKLSREYSIQFRLRNSSRDISAFFSLQAGLDNFSAELLPIKIVPKQGCVVQLSFLLNHQNEADYFNKIQKELQEIWGEKRTVQQSIQLNPFVENFYVQNRITIEFNRLILEDQMDDLMDMIDHMIETLTWMESLAE